MSVPFHRIRAYVRIVATAAIAVAVFAFAWFFRFNDPGGSFAFLTDDHFFYVVRGWQILFGDLPVRDFVDHGAPLYYYVAAAVQVLFGRGTLSEIAFSVTVLAACAVGVFLLSARASGSLLLALLATLWHVFLEPRYYNYPKILVYVVAIAALWAFVDRPDRRRILSLAAITVVAFLFRHDHGVFVAAAFAALLVIARELSWAQRIRSAVAYGLLVLLLLAPYLVFIQLNGGIPLYFRTAIAWSQHDRARAEVVWPGLFDNPDGVSSMAVSGNLPERVIATVGDNGIAWTFYAEIALPLLALVVALSTLTVEGAWPHGAEKIAVVAVLALLLDAGFLRSPLAARLADPSVPLAILVAWMPVGLVRLLRQTGTAVRPGRRAVGWTVAAATIVALASMGIAEGWTAPRRLRQTYLADGLDAAVDRSATVLDVVRRSFPISRDAVKRDSVLMLSVYVRDCTRPGDRVFMEHYLPQVIALSERAFAGGHADLRPGFFTSVEMQQLTVSRLRRQSVPMVFVGPQPDLGNFRESFPIVTSYFDEHYRSAGTRSFDNGRTEVQLLVRRDATPVRTFEPLGWPCYR